MTILVHRLMDKSMARATGQENVFPSHACRDIGSLGRPWDYVFLLVNGVEYNLHVSAAIHLYSVPFYNALATSWQNHALMVHFTARFFGFLVGHRVCPPLNKLENGFPHGQQNWEGERISFSCRPGYWLKGPSERHCLGNGLWTGKIPTCQFGEIFYR